MIFLLRNDSRMKAKVEKGDRMKRIVVLLIKLLVHFEKFKNRIHLIRFAKYQILDIFDAASILF